MKNISPNADEATARPSPPSSKKLIKTAVSLGATSLLLTGVAFFGALPAQAAEAKVDMGTAKSYAILGGAGVTNTGSSVISGDVGISPNPAITGFPPGIVNNGVIHEADAPAADAQAALTTAYDDAAGRSTTVDVTGQNLGGMTLTTGVYSHTSGLPLSGVLTLDAQNDPDAVFIFKAGSTLITAPNSKVELVNGANPCNVYWQVGSSATLDTNTTFVGTVMALTSIQLNDAATVDGRVLARNGEVTLINNVITSPDCDTVPNDDDDDTTPPNDDDNNTPPDNDDNNTPPDNDDNTTPPVDNTDDTTPPDNTDNTTPPVDNTDDTTPNDNGKSPVPKGHPSTGLGGTAPQNSDPNSVLLSLALLTATGAVGVTITAFRIKATNKS